MVKKDTLKNENPTALTLLSKVPPCMITLVKTFSFNLAIWNLANFSNHLWPFPSVISQNYQRQFVFLDFCCWKHNFYYCFSTILIVGGFFGFGTIFWEFFIFLISIIFEKCNIQRLKLKSIIRNITNFIKLTKKIPEICFLKFVGPTTSPRLESCNNLYHVILST